MLLARLAGSIVSSARSWLIDIGSTTTDIVPLTYGQPIPQGMTDWDRLLCGELVYTGMERTPVPALVQSLPHRGKLTASCLRVLCHVSRCLAPSRRPA